MIKNNIRKIVRWSVSAREQETVADALRRHQVNSYSKFDHVKYDAGDVAKALRQIGITPGDTVMVHSQWRSFYGFQGGSPELLIQLLLESVRGGGTLLMPSHGYDKNFFDVRNTPSSMGVVSEVFRKMDGVKRACIPHFSVATVGCSSDEYLSMCPVCHYGFDEYSPYSLMSEAGGKVLLLGMGKHTPKISAFHIAAYRRSKEDSVYGSAFVDGTCHVIDREGKESLVAVLRKAPGVRNDNAAFRRVFKLVPKRTAHLGKLTLTAFNCSDAVEVCYQEICKGALMYKGLEL